MRNHHTIPRVGRGDARGGGAGRGTGCLSVCLDPPATVIRGKQTHWLAGWLERRLPGEGRGSRRHAPTPSCVRSHSTHTHSHTHPCGAGGLGWISAFNAAPRRLDGQEREGTDDWILIYAPPCSQNYINFWQRRLAWFKKASVTKFLHLC